MTDMREIKFRGYNSDKGWVYGSLIQKHKPTEVENVYWCSLIHNGALDAELVATESVGQYTGLKDKNGKEIYEGDILKHPIEKRWFPWLIEFHGGSFCLVNIGIDGYKHEPMYLTEDRVSEREVIGNIWENPELIK